MNPNTLASLQKLMKTPRVVFGLFVLLFIFLAATLAPWIAHFDPEDMDITLRLQPPTSEHWLGCDLNGRDVYTSMLFGARLSLYIAFLTVFISVTVGTLIGLISGYKLGWIDMIFMRLVDIIMAVPGILVAMVLSALLGAGINNVVFAIAATGWTSSARLIRGQVLTLRERDYVLASKSLGARDLRLMFRHILPGTFTPMIVHATFSLSGVILVEASLSFLGLGVQDGSPTWGALLGQGRSVLSEAPFLSVVPGLAIMTLVLALNFLGDGLRDALDPREKQR